MKGHSIVQEIENNLEKILKKMDLPWNRKTEMNPAKLKWLKKNLGLRNENNKNYPTAMEYIEALIKRG